MKLIMHLCRYTRIYIPVIEKFSLNDKLNNTNIKNKNLFENIEEINISSAVALDQINELIMMIQLL